MAAVAPKKRLERLVEDILRIVVNEQRQMQRGAVFPASIDPQDALWFAQAVQGLAAGTEKSLDKALGLAKGRGRQKAEAPTGANYERAKAIFYRKEFGGATWDEIADDHPETDLRQLQREMKRYTPDIIAEFSRELTAEMKAEGVRSAIN